MKMISPLLLVAFILTGVNCSVEVDDCIISGVQNYSIELTERTTTKRNECKNTCINDDNCFKWAKKGLKCVLVTLQFSARSSAPGAKSIMDITNPKCFIKKAGECGEKKNQKPSLSNIWEAFTMYIYDETVGQCKTKCTQNSCSFWEYDPFSQESPSGGSKCLLHFNPTKKGRWTTGSKYCN